MNDQIFIDHIKLHYPYLYHIEMEKRRIVDKYGFGEISTNIKIQNNKTTYMEFLNVGTVRLDGKKFT